MSTVLFLNAEGPSWWHRERGVWQPFTGETQGPVWVIADLTEETIAEIAVPRLFGRDRKQFVLRQIATRFPESPFCTTFFGRPTGSLMNRLAPPKQVLMAIEPAERLLTVLSTVTQPLAGVWSISVLLAQLARASALPDDLLIVLGQASSARIVYLKDRAPVLTRLVPGATTAAEQAAEVVRTLRHLENTHIVQRGVGRMSAFCLGTPQGLVELLVRDRIDAVAHSDQHKFDEVDGWRKVLFDQVCKSPPGQLAPVALREAFLTQRVKKSARYAMVACAVIAAIVASGSVVSNLSSWSLQVALKNTASELDAQTTQLDASLASFGVAPDMLRRVLMLDSDEITNAPDIQRQLQDISRAVSSVPSARVVALQWQVLNAQTPSCTTNIAGDPVVTTLDTTPASVRKVELKLAFALANDALPRLQFQQVAQITQQIKSIAGITVVQDPTSTLSDSGPAPAGVGSGETRRQFSWCLQLPGLTGPGASL